MAQNDSKLPTGTPKQTGEGVPQHKRLAQGEQVGVRPNKGVQQKY